MFGRLWKRGFWGALLVALSCVVLGGAGYLFLHRSPAIQLDDVAWDFGILLPGAIVQHRFAIANSGGMPLHVERIRTGCQYLSAELSSEPIQPGEHASLEITMQAPLERGSDGFSVWLETNDPQNPTSQLTIAFSVEPAWRVLPNLVDLGLVGSAGLPVRRTVRVEANRDDLSLDGLHVECESPDVEVTSVEETAPGTYEVRLELAQTAATGPLDGFMLLRSGQSSPVAQRVQIVGRVLGSVRAWPEVLYFHEVPVAGAAADVQLRGEGLRSVRKALLSPSIRDLASVTWSTVEEGVDLRVQVSQPHVDAGAGARTSVVRGSVRVTTDGGRNETIELPVIIARTARRPEPPAENGQDAGDETDDQLLVTMGVGMGPVRFGMTKEEVVQFLGSPDLVSPDGHSLVYRSKGFTVRCEAGIGVQSFLCASNVDGDRHWWKADFSGHTKEGIRIGSTEEQIIAAYGEPDSIEGPGGQRDLVYRGLRARFILVGDRLVNFTVTSPSTP